MLRLFFNKLWCLILYFALYLFLTLIISIFLAALFSPAFLGVFSMLAIIIAVTVTVLRRRYRDNAQKRKYLDETKSFKLISEIKSIVHMPDFIAEFILFAAVSIGMCVYSILSSDLGVNLFVKVFSVFTSSVVFTSVATLIDIAFYLIIRYKWNRERLS